VAATPYIDHYDNGLVKSTGFMEGGQMAGYWEWFRRDGSKMRTGNFENGLPFGEWITYDRQGQAVKVTTRKGK
jgi:antitoxin component YwqK of YwqJK toxin-antitoxin module